MDAFRDFLNRIADIESHMFEPLNANNMAIRNELFAELEQMMAPPPLNNRPHIDRLQEMEDLALDYRNERNDRAVGIPGRVDLLEQVRQHLENRIRQMQGLPPLHNNEMGQAPQMNINVNPENMNMHVNNQNENMKGGRRRRRRVTRKTRKARKPRKSRKSYRRRN